MGSLAYLTPVWLAVSACTPPTGVIRVAQPPDPVPVARPPAAATPPAGPVVLDVTPFTATTLATPNEPAFEAGTIRTIRRLSGVGTIDDVVFDVPRRVVIGSAGRWWLVDPIEDRTIAEVGHPQSLLSDNELIVRRGDRDEIVDLRDGTTIVPTPKLPIAAPIDSTYIVNANEQDGSDWYAVERAEAGADVFLIATAAGRRFVGSWNDRAPRPELVDEIEDTTSGWRATRWEGGLELRFGVPKTCKRLRLQRDRQPACVDPRFETVNVGSWFVTVEAPADTTARLVAHDTATGRDEVVALPCKKPRIDGRSLNTPRVLVECDDYPYRTQTRIIAWTPGRARIVEPAADERLPGHVLFGRLAPLVSESSDTHGNQIGQRWLDLDGGVVFRGPVLANLDIESGPRMVALAGTGATTRVAVIDADRGTVRDAGPMACRGEILLDKVKGDYTAISCGIADRPGVFDFARVWSKIIDTRSSKIYDLPGYPAALFADGTVILSNRTRLTAETRGPHATLTVARLE